MSRARVGAVALSGFLIGCAFPGSPGFVSLVSGRAGTAQGRGRRARRPQRLARPGALCSDGGQRDIAVIGAWPLAVPSSRPGRAFASATDPDFPV